MWNVFQELEIQNLQQRASLTDANVEFHAQRQGRRSDSIEDDVTKLVMISQALFELVAERLEISEAELLARVHEIDMRDGVADGRITPRPRTCPGCAAAVPADRDSCQFCGTHAPGRDPFAS